MTLAFVKQTRSNTPMPAMGPSKAFPWSCREPSEPPQRRDTADAKK
jgi:hypothetical protein